jgi:hypothetical protein
MIMRDRVRESFGRFLNLPDFATQPGSASGTNQKPRFDYRLMRSDGAGFPDSADLEAVASLSDDNRRIRRANPELTKLMRKNLYALWYRANPQCFCLLERVPKDENQVSIIGNTIVLPLTAGTFSRIQEGQLAVVDLRKEDICPIGQKHDVLLFDTWILHNDYQEPRIFARKRHYGFGNYMVLKHLSMFTDVGSKPTFTVYVEPDSNSMLDMLLQMGFAASGHTKISEPLLKLAYPFSDDETIENVAQRQQIESLVALIGQARNR